MCIDIDATLIIAHSDGKDGAATTYKRTWGFHPIGAWLDRGDGLGEALAGPRPGSAGANTATDHIDCFKTALAQLPALPDGVRLVVRADTAGCTHAFLDYLRQAVSASPSASRWAATPSCAPRSAICPTTPGRRRPARTARCATAPSSPS